MTASSDSDGQEPFLTDSDSEIMVYPRHRPTKNRQKCCKKRTVFGIISLLTFAAGLVLFAASYYISTGSSVWQRPIVVYRATTDELSSENGSLFFREPAISRSQAVAYAKKQGQLPKLAFREGNLRRNFDSKWNLSWKSIWSDDAHCRFDIKGNDVLVFIHIQKTGGTTLERFVTRHLNTTRPCQCTPGVKRCKCLRPLFADHEKSDEWEDDDDFSSDSEREKEDFAEFSSKNGGLNRQPSTAGEILRDFNGNSHKLFRTLRGVENGRNLQKFPAFKKLSNPLAANSHQSPIFQKIQNDASSGIANSGQTKIASREQKRNADVSRNSHMSKRNADVSHNTHMSKRNADVSHNTHISKRNADVSRHESGQWLFSRMSTGWSCGLHADWTELVTTDCVGNVLDRLDGVDLKRRYFYLTLLREPVSRFISEYAHVRRGATWPSSHECAGRPATPEELPLCFDPEDTWSGVGLDEFLACPYNLAFNRQTRMLADLRLVNCYNTSGQDEKVREELLLASAKNNLENMAWFGLLEDMGRTQRSFEATFDLQFSKDFQPPYKSKSNKTVVSEAQMVKIRKLNNLDLELYEFAESLFEKRWNWLVSENKV